MLMFTVKIFKCRENGIDHNCNGAITKPIGFFLNNVNMVKCESFGHQLTGLVSRKKFEYV